MKPYYTHRVRATIFVTEHELQACTADEISRRVEQRMREAGFDRAKPYDCYMAGGDQFYEQEIKVATKDNPGKFDCYANAKPDEPMFVLLARDADAPALVEAWAKARLRQIATSDRPPDDAEQCLEAFECAAAMRAWKAKKDGAARVTQG